MHTFTIVGVLELVELPYLQARLGRQALLRRTPAFILRLTRL